MSRYVVEVFGADFVNRGGQLMLWTVLDRLRKRSPECVVAINAESGSPFADRASYGLYTFFPSIPRNRPRYARYAMPVGRLWSKLLRREKLLPYGLVGSHQADALLDVCGYAYGDVYSPAVAEMSAARFASYRRRGRPVVMLPQMLGPFEKPASAAAFRKVAAETDLIYARDPISHDAVAGVLSGSADGSPLRLAPDITIEAPPGDLPAGFKPTRPKYLTIVPNMRMLDKTDAASGWQEHYLERLRAAAAAAESAGYGVVLLQHESGGGDGELVDALATPDRIKVDDPDPRRLKAVLAGSELVLASRFHACVSSLSSGTPCVTFGWATKYAMLHEDFGLKETYFSSPPDGQAWPDMFRRFLDGAWLTSAASTLARAKADKLGAIAAMWDQVFDRLGLPAPVSAGDTD
ncbi:MAG: polysaccharide pyruvyl transferase family protein [Planctomycetota bacterium]